MAEKESSESPLVLVHRPPTLDYMDDYLSRNFRLLNAHDSSDPLPIFLSRHASSVRAFVNIGRLKIDADLLSHLPSLQILVCTSVGTDHVDLAECKRRGIAVTNAGDAFSDDVADCAVGLLISVLRRIPAADRYVRSGNWGKFGEFQLGIKVSGKRVGIIGLGSIGSRIAQRLEPFGCIISYNSRSQKPSMPYRYYPDVLSLAANNDVLFLCCALTDKTQHIVNREVMESLGKDGVIINVGRGGLIDEKEMVKCLVEGVIGGAGLDVFEKEPQVPEELFGLDNVVLSPHAAVATPGSLDSVAEIALDGKKVGIVGLGSIDSLVPKRLEPFGCIISYNARNSKPDDVPYFYYPHILSLAADNDVLILCCSLIDETQHIVNRDVMETLGKNGIIINIGRGGIIDEREMVNCLIKGVIWGVGLDVFDNEPEVPEELFGLENVVLSPHAAITKGESLNNVSEVSVANLKAFFSDQPLISPVQLG